MEQRNILDMVLSMLDIITAHGIRIRPLPLDGGFHSISTIGYLDACGINRIMYPLKLKRQRGDNEVDIRYTTKSHNRRKISRRHTPCISV